MSQSFSRREIAKLLGVSAASLAATVSGLSAQRQPLSDTLDVAVIGAGAAGLTAGFLLDQAGLNFRVFEADARYGGRAKTDTTLADFPLELGGEWVHTRAEVLNTLSQTSSASRTASEWRPTTCHVWDGQRLYQDDSYALQWRGEQRFTTTTWFDFFDTYMARGIRDRIVLNAIVSEIDYRGDVVTLRFAGGAEVTARHVIVTVPLNVLKDGDIRFTPDLPRRNRRALDGVVMPDGFKLFMRFRDRFYPDMVLFDHGHSTPEAEIMYYNAALDKPTQQNILGLFAHGVVATPFTRLNEGDLVQAALAQLDQLYGGAASPAYMGHVLQNWSTSRFHRGTYSYFHGSRPSALGASIDGRIHFAGEAYNRRFDGEWGYMHVASRTAYDALNEII